ncbi:hypothetical protein LTR08_008880 [Meristemomyces frigidus]|nr:hypothetical protein LTR08_008880 [Meristemomyces frigidus]
MPTEHRDIFDTTDDVYLSPEEVFVPPSATTAVFKAEAARFPPLHYAMCAISTLNLAYRGQQSLEQALQHYHRALSTVTTATTPDDLISDGVFLRHFLLFVYDTCVPTDTGSGDDEMWAQHLNHLRQIAVQRHDRLATEPYGYIMWSICELDMYACLLGNGSCEFFRTIVQLSMLPPLEHQLPRVGFAAAGPFSPDEMRIMPTLLHLNQGVLIHTAKLAQVAQQYRAEHAARRASASPGTYARWQAKVSQAQSELVGFWNRSWPEFLGPEAPQAGYSLPHRARYTVEHAMYIYQAAVLYVRTTMFPGQRLIPIANQADIHIDTERRCQFILTMASADLERGLMERRHIVFPLLMAGFATTQPDAKIQAINIMTAFQREGSIGQNTHRTRQLLVAVCEEQGAVVSAGGRMEQVEWLALAKERGLSVVNCGL